MNDETLPYDSFLLVSFGGPEGMDDVIPFLENVLRGKHVPRERMMEVAEHYRHFGGISPINQQNRDLIESLRQEFELTDITLPIYWGNRNWHPLLADTLARMREDGRKRSLAFFTSMFSCYSGCRQYRENIANAQQEVGPGAPIVDKLRMGFNHPRFIETMVDSLQRSIATLGIAPADAVVLFTAHSIPLSMSDHCDYVRQLQESCRLVAAACGASNWRLVYQSRSGPPQQPWLEPDVCDVIRELGTEPRPQGVVVVPIGFISDHMEVMFDLDEQAAEVCREQAIPFARAATAGTHRAFVQMIRELVVERLNGSADRSAVGNLGPWHDVCPEDCCLYRPQRPASGG